MEMKTAATVLQEMMVKLHTIPEYEFIAQSGPQHQAMFEYRCKAQGIEVTARGRCKKDAKQEVAKLMLKKLAAAGYKVPHPYGLDNYTPMGGQSIPGGGDIVEPASQGARSFVALLKELCAEYRLPAVEYDLVSDTGPPHQRHFTMKARVGQHSREATSTTKKAARQIAAEKLYTYLRENLARMTKDFDEADALVRAHERVMDRYLETTEEANRRPDLGQKVADYHLGLQTHLEPEVVSRGRGALSLAEHEPAERALAAAAAALGLSVLYCDLPREQVPLSLSLSLSLVSLAEHEPAERALAAAAAALGLSVLYCDLPREQVPLSLSLSLSLVSLAEHEPAERALAAAAAALGLSVLYCDLPREQVPLSLSLSLSLVSLAEHEPAERALAAAAAALGLSVLYCDLPREQVPLSLSLSLSLVSLAEHEPAERALAAPAAALGLSVLYCDLPREQVPLSLSLSLSLSCRWRSTSRPSARWPPPPPRSGSASSTATCRGSRYHSLSLSLSLSRVAGGARAGRARAGRRRRRARAQRPLLRPAEGAGTTLSLSLSLSRVAGGARAGRARAGRRRRRARAQRPLLRPAEGAGTTLSLSLSLSLVSLAEHEPAERALAAAAAALGLSVLYCDLSREQADPLVLVSLEPSAPAVVLAGETRAAAAAAALRYLRLTLEDPKSMSRVLRMQDFIREEEEKDCF
ncbi:uncharacterized protein LOC128669606 [Plodia interpunctella]|uniref:uncharacterized protein LOC128669606 n=1 Tax=Plodia interpunctella TaxID=58824 RepID=UPI0031015FCC